jgi:hypothetical protein
VNRRAPFTRSDLDELGEFFGEALAVVSMREILAGNRDARVVGLRHDVDNAPAALDTAVEMARWEAAHGWRSTYFLLHTAEYWRDGRVFDAAERIALLGHEIGLHADAVAEALRHGGDPAEMIHEALAELRDRGHVVTGVVGHGNPLCHRASFANDEQFLECVRSGNGEPDRELRFRDRMLRLEPRSLAEFGLEYESIGLRCYDRGDGVMRTRPNQLYNTDSAGGWFYPFEDTIRDFRVLHDGQLHLLVHPDWWSEAFVAVAV